MFLQLGEKPQEGHGSKILAAIDIGSNSIHLLVAQVDEHGHLEVLDAEKVSIRLGQAIAEKGYLDAKAIQTTTKVLLSMIAICRPYQCMVRAVATHAVREAQNFHEAVEEIYKKTSLRIEIIDGEEEARLVFLGMRHGLSLPQKNCLALDIGGGSTEILLASGDHIHFVSSLKLGAVTLSSLVFQGKIPSQKSIKQLYDTIDVQLMPVAGDAKKSAFHTAVASSGTAKTLALLHAKRRGAAVTGDDINGYILPRAALISMCKKIEKLREPEKIRKILGVHPRRADILLAGAAILRRVTEVLRVDQWTISSFGLREGVVLDTYDRLSSGRRVPRDAIWWQSVRSFGSRFAVSEKVATHTARLAVGLFDSLHQFFQKDLSPFAEKDLRQMLQSAAYLLEVGRYVSKSGFHRHSYYLISNGRLLGFSQDERHFVAALARYHRKSPPSQNHPECAHLSSKEYRYLVILSGLLRIAAALNRTRQGVVTGLHATLKNQTLKVVVKVGRGKDAHVELEQLAGETANLEKSLKVKFKLVVAE